MSVTRYCWLYAASLCYDARALLRVNPTKALGLIVDLNARELHTPAHSELRGNCPCD